MEPKGSLPYSQEPPTGPYQINPVHNTQPCLCNIHSNIILPSTPKFSEWFPSGFRNKIIYTLLIPPMNAPNISCSKSHIHISFPR
jgi:hypothetical protein